MQRLVESAETFMKCKMHAESAETREFMIPVELKNGRLREFGKSLHFTYKDVHNG